jgi:hypothetical protein
MMLLILVMEGGDLYSVSRLTYASEWCQVAQKSTRAPGLKVR